MLILNRSPMYLSPFKISSFTPPVHFATYIFEYIDETYIERLISKLRNKKVSSCAPPCTFSP